MEITELIILALIPLAAITESYFDVKAVNRGVKIEHKISATVRAFLALMISIFTQETLSKCLIFSILLLIMYWSVFDIFWNKWKKINPYYISSRSNSIEGWFKKRGADGRSFLALKVFFFSMFLLLYKKIDLILNYIGL